MKFCFYPYFEQIKQPLRLIVVISYSFSFGRFIHWFCAIKTVSENPKKKTAKNNLEKKQKENYFVRGEAKQYENIKSRKWKTLEKTSSRKK